MDETKNIKPPKFKNGDKVKIREDALGYSQIFTGKEFRVEFVNKEICTYNIQMIGGKFNDKFYGIPEKHLKLIKEEKPMEENKTVKVGDWVEIVNPILEDECSVGDVFEVIALSTVMEGGVYVRTEEDMDYSDDEADRQIEQPFMKLYTQEYKIIEKPKEENLDHIEERLGVRKGEKFNIKGVGCNPYVYTGEIIKDINDCYLTGCWMAKLINNPDLIEKIPEKVKIPKMLWKLIEAMEGIGYKEILFSPWLVSFRQNNEHSYVSIHPITKIAIDRLVFNAALKISDILHGDKYIMGE